MNCSLRLVGPARLRAPARVQAPLGGRYRLLVAGMKETARRDANRVRPLPVAA